MPIFNRPMISRSFAPRLKPAMSLALLGLSAGIAAQAGNHLANGASLAVGESLDSNNGKYQMVVLPDGKLAVYQVERPVAESGPAAPGGPALAAPTVIITPLWESANADGLEGKGTLELQRDNNLVLCDTLGDGRRVLRWESGTAKTGKVPATLVLEDDGTLHLWSAGQCLWTTDSAPTASLVTTEETKASPAPSVSVSAPVRQEEPQRSQGLSIGGGSSRVQVSLGSPTEPARGFSIGGGRSKITFSFGR